MRIGIITFHFPYNCGAVLQCLALQTKLEEMGHEVSIINYRPWYHQNRYTPLRNPIYLAQKRFRDSEGNVIKRGIYALDGFCRVVHSWKHYPSISLRERKFRTFTKRYFKETRIYRSIEDLKSEPPSCEIYIAGSDQLWNPEITDGKLDEAYFLNFGKNDVRRIIYAVGADLGTLDKPEMQLKKLVKRLDAISLREVQWRSTVEDATDGIIPVSITLDPTLLLMADQYKSYMAEHEVESQPYILTYTMTGKAQDQVYSYAKCLAQKTGLKIIDIAGDPGAKNKVIEDNRLCGPDDFLWYIYHAKYIVTNSFHGTVFSILFKKKFFTIPHTVTGNRVTELLDKIGLTSRYYREGLCEGKNIDDEINYEAVMEKVEQMREESIIFLKENI